MNCGFEDCVEFLNLTQSLKSWDDVLSTFFERRKKNADAIAQMSLENFVEMSSKVGDSEFLLEKELERKLEEAFPERFKSRYGRVAYSLEPYADVVAAGGVQMEILRDLMNSTGNGSPIDLDRARKLVETRLPLLG